MARLGLLAFIASLMFFTSLIAAYSSSPQDTQHNDSSGRLVSLFFQIEIILRRQCEMQTNSTLLAITHLYSGEYQNATESHALVNPGFVAGALNIQSQGSYCGTFLRRNITTSIRLQLKLPEDLLVCIRFQGLIQRFLHYQKEELFRKSRQSSLWPQETVVMRAKRF